MTLKSVGEIIKRYEGNPVLAPETEYEKKGFRGNVIFPGGG